MNCNIYVENAMNAAHSNIVNNLKDLKISGLRQLLEDEGYHVDDCMSSYKELGKAIDSLATSMLKRAYDKYEIMEE